MARGQKACHEQQGTEAPLDRTVAGHSEGVGAYISEALVPTAPQDVSQRDERQDHAQERAD